MLRNFVESLIADISDEILEICLLVPLDRVEHALGTTVEMGLNIHATVCKEVDQGSLLDEVVLIIDANVLHLLLGGDEPLLLCLLSLVSPLCSELLALVSTVDVVEVGEFGTNEESEVTHLADSQVEGEDVLVVEDHTTEPLVMGPATHTRQ